MQKSWIFNSASMRCFLFGEVGLRRGKLLVGRRQVIELKYDGIARGDKVWGLELAGKVPKLAAGDRRETWGV